MMRQMLVVLIFCCFDLFAGLSVAQQTKSSTRDDQTDLAVTVYNSNLGLVKDTREIVIGKGLQELMFKDVAERIKATTVHVKSLTDADGLTVLEQNYEYDLLSQQKLLEKFVGQEIHFVQTDRETGKQTVTKAELLSTGRGNIFRVDGKIVFDVPGSLELPKIPENLIAKPTLAWMLDAKKGGTHKIEASYLTDGINWHADYIAVLNEKDTALDLSGWVTIDNKSGATYENAALKLVAGDLQRVQPEYARRARFVSGVRGSEAPKFEEASFFEYHIYTLGRRTTIKNNQTKQMELLNSTDISIQKEYTYRGDRSFYTRRITDLNKENKVGVSIRFDNVTKNNLGMPLPKGTVRAYKKDKDGSLQFVGENTIDHTPKDEGIRIKIGDAFDIVAERKQTDFKTIAQAVVEVGFEIELRNHKDENITVTISEPVYGDWEMLEASHKYEKASAGEVLFPVDVKAGEQAVLTYRARLKF